MFTRNTRNPAGHLLFIGRTKKPLKRTNRRRLYIAQRMGSCRHSRSYRRNMTDCSFKNERLVSCWPSETRNCRVCAISKRTWIRCLPMSILRWSSILPVRKNLVNTTSAQKRLAGKERPYTDLCPLRQIGIGLFFRFGTSNQPEDVAERLHNRRACSALQGIGGWATNKQSAKSKTFALLANIISSLINL